MLVDLRTFDPDLSGKKARLALDKAGISLNENTVPDDPRPPYITSGLRIGTPAVTTQGMGEAEMATIAELIHRTLVGREDDAELAAVKDDVARPLLEVRAVPHGHLSALGAGLPRGLPPRHRSRRARHAADDAAVPAAVVQGRRRAGARRSPRAHPAHRAARRRRHPRRLPQPGCSWAGGPTASTRCSSPAPCRSASCSPRSSIFAVGQVDDLREVSPPAKLAGTVLAGSVLSISGVSILFFRIPFAGLVSLSPDMSALLTVVWVIGMTTAINYIDGLDGLAAGIVAIAAAALLIYCERLHSVGRHRTRQRRPAHRRRGARRVPRLPARTTSTPPRSSWATPARCCSGCCWPPITITVGGNTDTPFSGQTFFFFAPLFIPLVILGVPIVDTAFSILRRARRGTNVTVADKDHLHHRLMRLGHGQRRSVLILWTWTLLLSAIVLYPTYQTVEGELWVPHGDRSRGSGAVHHVRPGGAIPPRGRLEDRFARHRTLGFACPAPRVLDCEQFHKRGRTMAFDLSAKRELNKGFGDALSVAVELAVTPAIFAFLGWRLDEWLGTTPLFLLVFFLFTFTYVAWREYTKYQLPDGASTSRSSSAPKREGTSQ